MNEHKNTILAIVLSLIVVIGWEYFFAKPELQQQQAQHIRRRQSRAKAPAEHSRQRQALLRKCRPHRQRSRPPRHVRR